MSGPAVNGKRTVQTRPRAGYARPLRYCNLYTASISVSTSLKCSSIEQ